MLLSCVLLSAIAIHGAGTQLRTNGQISFEADSRVTFGASYSSAAVKATIAASTATAVRIWVEQSPRNVFVNSVRLSRDKWAYDDASQLVAISVPGGTSTIQVRFDGLESLVPSVAAIPVYLCMGNWERGDALAPFSIRWENERVSGMWLFAGAPSGLYEIRCRRRGMAVAASECGLTGDLPVPGEGGYIFLSEGSRLSIVQSVDGKQYPFDGVELRCAGEVTDTTRLEKAKRLAAPDLIVVEAEAFTAEGGGVVKKSKEHGNTHGGECIFTWAKPGHWIEWQVEIPRTGLYAIAFMVATSEEEALRTLAIDGVAVTGASVLRFTSTGGWGRGSADEWQLFEPVSGQGAGLSVRLTAGKRTLRMNNLLGQHCNLDVILLNPEVE